VAIDAAASGWHELQYGQNPLRTFTRNFPVDWEVANLLQLI